MAMTKSVKKAFLKKISIKFYLKALRKNQEGNLGILRHKNHSNNTVRSPFALITASHK